MAKPTSAAQRARLEVAERFTPTERKRIAGRVGLALVGVFVLLVALFTAVGGVLMPAHPGVRAKAVARIDSCHRSGLEVVCAARLVDTTDGDVTLGQRIDVRATHELSGEVGVAAHIRTTSHQKNDVTIHRDEIVWLPEGRLVMGNAWRVVFFIGAVLVTSIAMWGASRAVWAAALRKHADRST